MSQMAITEGWQNHDPGFADMAKMAERELAAFFSAVRKLFGAKQAELAAEDWLQELETTDSFPIATREWRLITIHAARRLARRINGSFQRD